jgi:hypothetical protein
MLDVGTHIALLRSRVCIEAVDIGTRTTIGMGIGRCFDVYRQLPEVWCGYARIVIFTDRRGRNEGR